MKVRLAQRNLFGDTELERMHQASVIEEVAALISKVWKQVKKRFKSSGRTAQAHQPTVIPVSQHKIKRKLVSPHALQTVECLQKAGHEAYLVGGSVRDLLLGRKPKDYDIATSAKPNQVRQLFRRSRVIGRRFKLVHVYYRGEVIEVATFRANVDAKQEGRRHNEAGMILSDNVFGSLDEDAWRRDFTINAFYYDPSEDVVLDYVDGLKDLKAGQVATIGEPEVRFQEDPIRLLRALRFAAKLEFALQQDLEKALLSMRETLFDVPGSRLYDAFIQVFFAGYAEAMYRWMRQTGYFELLFEATAKLISQSKYQSSAKLIELAMQSTDKRYHGGKSLNPGYLLSVILWPALQRALAMHKKQGHRFHKALHMSVEEVLVKHQASLLVLPARTVAMIRSIWLLQFVLKRRRPSRVLSVLEQRYFRAAFDLLEMRAHFESKLKPVVDWWRQFQSASEQQQERMVHKLTHGG